MRIALFGADTGRQVLEQALAAGLFVTALVRTRAELTIEDDALKVIIGELDREQDVHEVVAGSHAVISALSAGRSRKPTAACTDGVRAILAAMKAHDVRRILAVSAHGVAETHDRSAYVRKVWRLAPEWMRDKEAMEELLRASDVDWTVVRPPGLTSGAFTGRYRVGTDLPMGALTRISHADVADFLLAATLDATYVQQAVTIRG